MREHQNSSNIIKRKGLYDFSYEHDACGVGLVANIDGQRTYKIIQQGIEVLIKLLHRGAVGGDANTGDGAGILFEMPFEFFDNILKEKNIEIPENNSYGVGMTFLPIKLKIQLNA